MKTDIQIAQEAEMKHIREVAETTGLYGLVIGLILLYANPLFAKL